MPDTGKVMVYCGNDAEVKFNEVMLILFNRGYSIYLKRENSGAGSGSVFGVSNSGG
jgi:hypothetical protein